MIPGGNYIRTAGKELISHLRRNTKSVSGIFSVDDDYISTSIANKSFKFNKKRPDSGLTDYVAKNQSVKGLKCSQKPLPFLPFMKPIGRIQQPGSHG